MTCPILLQKISNKHLRPLPENSLTLSLKTQEAAQQEGKSRIPFFHTFTSRHRFQYILMR